MPASRRSRNSSTTSSSSSLPGLAPLPLRPNFPDVFCKSGRKERPALVVPRFDLIGLPQLFRGKTVSPPRWERPASSPSSLRLSGGGSARLGTRHPRRRRRRRSEKLSRDSENNRIRREICPLPSNFLTFLPRLRGNWRPAASTDAREEGVFGSIAAGNRPPRRYCRPFSLTPWWGWIRGEIQQEDSSLSRGYFVGWDRSGGRFDGIFISDDAFSVTESILIFGRDSKNDFKFEKRYHMSMNNLRELIVNLEAQSQKESHDTWR